MESSDDSFVWTNASSDSYVSDKVMDSAADKHDEGSESGYDYKKKLHKKILNGVETQKSKKAKKRKHEDITSESSDHQPASKKRIKSENSETCDDLLNADSYLNLRVKEEQKSFREQTDLLPKKKKKHKRSLNEDDSLNLDLTNEATEPISVNDTIVEINEKEISFEKKKKKKKKRHDVTVSEDERVSDQTVVKEKSKKKSKHSQDIENGNDNSVISNDHNGRSFVSSTLIDNTVNESQIVNEVNVFQDNIIAQNKSKDTPLPPKSIPNKLSKISDRLRFEDDSSLNMEFTVNKNISLSNNDNVKHFKNLNPHLSESKIKYKFVESDDEEEWILNCPSDMNIDDFKDLDLLIEGKSKTKIAGQVYDRMKNESITRLTQITYCNNKPVMRNVRVMGYFRFCKRISKPHISDDSMMINNQTNFIPLPDTKCRHPLFGPNYKKLIKVPKCAQQLVTEESSISVPKTKKKKHKKEKTKVEIDSEVDTKPTTDSDAPRSKKKRKRKNSCKEEISPRVSKKIKLEKNSAPTWESEQAIEENLFNF